MLDDNSLMGGRGANGFGGNCNGKGDVERNVDCDDVVDVSAAVT
jgi:hypothetical protein